MTDRAQIIPTTSGRRLRVVYLLLLLLLGSLVLSAPTYLAASLTNHSAPQSKDVRPLVVGVPIEREAELMKLFYQGMLKDNLRPAAALRAAQTEMSKQKRWAPPYFWAAFVMQGEWK